MAATTATAINEGEKGCRSRLHMSVVRRLSSPLTVLGIEHSKTSTDEKCYYTGMVPFLTYRSVIFAA